MIGESLIAIVNTRLKKTALPKVSDWDRLFTLAKKHSLSTIFYQAIKDESLVPEKLKKEAENQYLSEVNQQILQEYYGNLIFEKFTEAGIRYMPMKGWILRGLYPSPELRTSCDLDFFYDKEKKGEVESLIKTFGFKKVSDGINHTEWSKDKVTVESHHELYAQKESFAEYYRDIWNRLISSDGLRYDFSPEDFYVYFVAHASRHFRSGGFGVRTVLDVYIYTQKTSLNREYLSAEFIKLGLAKFVDVIEKLANVWFGGGAGDEETELLGEYILSSGTYGLAENNAAIKGTDGTTENKAKKKYLLRTIFPPYRVLKNLYPVLKKAPFLLPFFWVYKWFNVLFTRPKRFKSTIKNMKKIDREKLQYIDRVLKIVDIPKN